MSEYPYVSECCGSQPKSNGDMDTSDIGICSDCGDHCDYGYFDADGNFFETEDEAEKSDNLTQNK